MRTNTWLGLIVFGQAVHGHVAHRDAKLQREQHAKIAAEQAARDRVRDEKFDSAMSGLHRGQFAMWVQTPDGERFEAWAQHALQASQALDDRQDAWELAWSEVVRREEQQAQQQAQAQRQAEQDRYVAERFVPVERRDFSRARQLTILAAAISLVGLVLIAAFASLAMPRYEDTALHYASWILLVPFLGGLAASLYFGYCWWVAPKNPEADDQRRRQALEQDFLSTNHASTPSAGRFSPPSWHEVADASKLRAVSLQLGTTAAEAHKIFPRRDQLLSLAGTYRTRTDLDLARVPADAARLLDAFRAQDVERLETLRTAKLS